MKTNTITSAAQVATTLPEIAGPLLAATTPQEISAARDAIFNEPIRNDARPYQVRSESGATTYFRANNPAQACEFARRFVGYINPTAQQVDEESATVEARYMRGELQPIESEILSQNADEFSQAGGQEDASFFAYLDTIEAEIRSEGATPVTRIKFADGSSRKVATVDAIYPPHVSQWPFPAAYELYNAGDDSFIETTSRAHWQMLGAVPPRIQRGSDFLAGEAWHHNEAGQPIYAAFYKVAGRFFCRMETRQQFELNTGRAAVMRQLAAIPATKPPGEAQAVARRLQANPPGEKWHEGLLAIEFQATTGDGFTYMACRNFAECEAELARLRAKYPTYTTAAIFDRKTGATLVNPATQDQQDISAVPVALTPEPVKRYTMSEIKIANANSGGLYFSAKHKGEKILPTIYQGIGGIYFVKSKRYEAHFWATVVSFDPQTAAVRNVETAANIEAARDLAKALAKAPSAAQILAHENRDATTAPSAHGADLKAFELLHSTRRNYHRHTR